MRIVFTAPGGAVVEAEGRAGERLLGPAQRAGMPLEGTCGGQMACGTCLVTLDVADAARLPPASADEEDMLDLLPAATRGSRLSCQVVLTPDLDGMNVAIRSASGNSQRL